MKRKIQVIVAALTLVFMLPLTVSPSSATPAMASPYMGEDAIGAFNMDTDTPVVLEKMALTYNVSEFPENFSSETFPTEKSNLLVKYSLYNPTEAEATVSIAFPLKKGAYSRENISPSDYGFNLDSEIADTVTRHTYHESNRSFDQTDDLQRLQNDYMEHSLLNKDTQITKYSYKISGVDTEAYPEAHFSFTMRSELSDRRIIVDASGKISYRDDVCTLSGKISSLDDGTVDIYVFGDPLIVRPSFKYFEDQFLNDDAQVEGKAESVSITSVDFLEFVYSNYDADREISEIDWYNIIINQIYAYNPRMAPLEELFGYDSLSENYVLSWYCADIPFAPGERIEFEVSMPIVPGADIETDPYIYEYYFADCMEITRADGYIIDVAINTDFYLIDYIDPVKELTDLEGITKTKTGYKISLDHVDDQTFLFLSLCEVENPEQDLSGANATLVSIFLIIIGIIIGILTLPFVVLSRIIFGIIDLFELLYQWICTLF